jgi:hypothetical protein
MDWSRSASAQQSFSPITEGPQAATPSAPTLAPRASTYVRRHLRRADARALEILGHAIEYLADEYAFDGISKGPLGNADPRIEAIQILKGLNLAIYFSGTEVQSPWERIRGWFARC